MTNSTSGSPLAPSASRPSRPGDLAGLPYPLKGHAQALRQGSRITDSGIPHICGNLPAVRSSTSALLPTPRHRPIHLVVRHFASLSTVPTARLSHLLPVVPIRVTP